MGKCAGVTTTAPAISLAAGAALVLALTGCDAGGGAESHDVVADEYAVLPGGTGTGGTEQVAYVPDGRVGLAVTQPRSRLAFTDVDYQGIEDLVAPEGFEFVGVVWDGTSAWTNELDSIMRGDVVARFTEDTERLPASLTLQVTPSGQDGVAEELDLGADHLGVIGDDGNVWVVVPEDARLAAEVTFDGVSQIVPLAHTGAGEPDPGPAAPLYDLAADLEVDRYGATDAGCPLPPRVDTGLDLSFACGVRQVWSVPYVWGLGWAPAGKTWLVADVDARAGDPHFLPGDDTVVDYVARQTAWQVTVDGVAPLARLETEYAPSGPGSRRLAWQVSAARDTHRMHLEVTYELTRQGRREAGPARTTATGVADLRVSATPREN